MTSSDRKSWDAIVIGGGHNGLVAAALLAKSGRKVLVLEAAGEVGGPGRTEEFYPGFRASTAHLLNRLHPDVIRTLELGRYGLDLPGKAAMPGHTPTPDSSPQGGGEPERAIRALDVPSGTAPAKSPSPLWGGVRGGGGGKMTFAPSVALSRDGAPLVLRGAYGERLDGASAAEEDAWRALRGQLLRHAGLLKPFLARRPPDLSGLSFSDRATLGMAALSLKRLGREEMRDFSRMLLMNVSDVLDEHLADDRLKGLVAFDAVLGSHLGPRSPTSLLGLYYRLAGEIGGQAGAQMLPAGGMGAVIAALAAAAERAGAVLRTQAPVERVRVASGRVAGVTLSDGEEIDAPVVLSAANPAMTFLDLVGARALDTGMVRKARRVRMKGDAAKLHLALDAVPGFTGVSAGDHQGRLVVAPSADHVECAFNPAKYGAFSPAPVMEIVLPSLTDPALAPDGACVLSAVVQYAPYALREGWKTGKPRLLEAILGTLEAYAPGIRRHVLHAELLTPVDLEARYRMPGGHWHHGELQVDQMLVSRPFFGAEGYDTPIEGLYLGGAGSHPGGGICGVSGMNAARRIISAEAGRKAA